MMWGTLTHQTISRFHVIAIGMNNRQDRGGYAPHPVLREIYDLRNLCLLGYLRMRQVFRKG